MAGLGGPVSHAFVFNCFVFFGIFNYHLRNSDRLAVVMLFYLIFKFVDKGIVVTQHNDCGLQPARKPTI
jgi:hypothetical protein